MVKRVATVLLAHGSSDPQWLMPFDGLVQHIRQQLNSERVEIAYMELAEPSMHSQIATLANEGFDQIDIMPLFFAAGRHLRKDVPGMIENQQEELKATGIDTIINLHPPIGLEPEVANAIRDIVVRQVTQAQTGSN